MFIGILTICFSISVYAQEMEPRSYSVVPVGLHAAQLAYTFSGGDVVSGLNSPVQNLNVNASIIGLGYVQTFSVFKKLGRIAAGLPYVFLNGTTNVVGVDTAASRNGFGDARIKFGINLLGSPVLAPKDFQKFQEHTVLGASVAFSVPIGQYYSDKLINIGSNRWGIKPEIGVSHREGRLFYECYAGFLLPFPTNNSLSNLCLTPVWQPEQDKIIQLLHLLINMPGSEGKFQHL